MTRMNRTLVVALLTILTPLAAHADQGGFTNSGGSTLVSSGVAITSDVATPAGTLSLDCPTIATGDCAGGSFTYLSNDGTTTITATFTSGTFTESCAGGGKGGHVTCGYSFTGYIRGTSTVNGSAQAIIGATSQRFGTGGAAAQGTTAYNSAYTPFYYSDSEQILRADDLQGTNQISFGSQGSGVGQFYGAYGIALDLAGRIYVADTYNCRIVRIDDMNGTNWTAYGDTCGSDSGEFYDPSGLAIDSAGRIYVMDTGNSRVVRMDDMNGTNWVSFGTIGSDVGQFSQWLTSVAVDASGRIYVPDTGNRRLVRIDDMDGSNWTELTQSPPVNGVSYYSFQSPVAVSIDSGGRIYIADHESYAPALVRVDDMTGANWTVLYVGGGALLNSISVDSSGTVFAGGGGAQLVDNMAAVLTSSGAIGPVGSYYVFGVTPIPLPNPRPSAISFSPSTLTFTQNIGTSASQPVTIANFGGSPLKLESISASDGFSVDPTHCPDVLIAGANCTVSLTFAPTVTGEVDGLLTVTDDSGNLGAAQSVPLNGVGTAPIASVAPAALAFSAQVLGTTSSAKSVVLQNIGTGPMQVATVIATAPFSQTNTCASIAPGASCTVSVSFTPTTVGSVSGTLTIADDAGTQTVMLTGTGSAPVTFSSSSVNFGTVAVGNTSATKTVTLTNRGNASLNFASVVTSAGFAVVSNTCGTSISARASCTVGLTFSPTAIGAATGTLTFTDTAATSPQTVNLTGTGSAPVTFSSNSLNFGTVRVGNTSAAKTVTLTNRGSASLSIASIVASAGFAVASNSCGASVAAGATCTVGMTFSPTATGAAVGTLTFTDGAATSPQTVNLAGTGK